MLRLWLVPVMLALALGACGGDDAPSLPDPVTDASAAHVHGLGVNPADGSLVIATHSGLLAVPEGERRATRVGAGRQDTMGFTVVGPDAFLASGHPGPGDELPPALGLIRSDDGGRSWDPVSLLGEVDFHVLRASGRTIYGVDSGTGALLASRDAGETWRRRVPPGPLVDLAIDPRDPARLVASSDEGLFASADGGRRWRPLARDRAGLLAWADELLLVDPAGAVHASADGGRRWRRVGRVDGLPVALTGGGGEVHVALDDGSVHRSSDGGRTWEARLTGV
jgi:hypothetical protein